MNKVLLIILDGFGKNPQDHQNAVLHAHTPFLNSLFKNNPYTEIEASGEAVGLPNGVMGNSEVGHLNIGAGRPVRQDLVRINEALEKNEIMSMDKMQELIAHAKKNNNRLHLMGLLSNGSVHSHIDHLKYFICEIQKHNIEIFLHAFMDGRDTAKDSGLSFVKEIEKEPGFIFASMQGRSIGMDRDRRWEKIEQAYNCFTSKGNIQHISPEKYLQDCYDQNLFDEFIPPILFDEKYKIENNDTVFFFNFRPDRARQITLFFHEKERAIKPGYFLCLTPYVPEEMPELPILFDKEPLQGGLSHYLSSLGYTQFKTAETEKFAHITYFFNGGEREPFQGEERVLVNSPRDVATYDLKPEMSAQEVTQALCKALSQNRHDFYLVNFANPDMVGHTGNYLAAIKALEFLDQCLKQIIDIATQKNIATLITADHGNCDQMCYPDGSIHTAHTTALVPFCLISHEKYKTQEGLFALKDIAPSILSLMNIPKAQTMIGNPVFTKEGIA
jgi:2,3-bisphosphoglycerate-independent phosphoglycerate mutase